MAYTPTEWETGDVITAAKLNKVEEGIAANDAAIAALPAGLALYGPYYAIGQATAAAGAKATLELEAIEDGNGVSVNYPQSAAVLVLDNVEVNMSDSSTPVAIQRFELPYYMDGWQNASISAYNTTDAQATVTGMITFFSSVEFPQDLS